jgi:ribosomal-protein-serine acetyltransferase
MLPYELPGGCLLRAFEERDAEEFDRVIEANRDHLAPWMPWVEAEHGAEARREFIRATRRQAAADDGFVAAIVDDGAIVGTIGFHRVDRVNRATSIGYWLAEDRQGRGTMTEAVRVLTAHALGEWRLNRVEIRVAVGNERSAAIPLRLGFVEEGVLREAERHGDRYLDLRVFSMLARDRAT